MKELGVEEQELIVKPGHEVKTVLFSECYSSIKEKQGVYQQTVQGVFNLLIISSTEQ